MKEIPSLLDKNVILLEQILFYMEEIHREDIFSLEIQIKRDETSR
jgi:hypothetical protein